MMDNDLHKLLHQLITTLKTKNKTITTAESCTGGLIASYLTELAGSSAWFERGFVTYSNLSKQEMLGVDEVLIREHGAVSEQVAESMALGALHHSAASVSLSVTGIAGPDGGSALKPVGTVCFAWAVRGHEVSSKRCCFANASREQVRKLACLEAFQGMLNRLV
jgi:nicotinamide-nucleotide amidase